MNKNDLRPQSLSDQAYELIRRKIVTLDLAPGDVINEATLQVELKLGRTPIREALRRLSFEKLVTIIPRRGMFVTDIGIIDLQRLFEVRLVTEELAARLAARRGTAEHWRQMEALTAQFPHTQTTIRNEQWITLDEAFHSLIYQAANNPFLHDTLIYYYTHSLRLWYFFLADIGDMGEAIKQHQNIFEALVAGDADKAAYHLHEHIQAFQDELQSVMLGIRSTNGQTR
ncbi:MAG: GntR family transcriptional regulator [Anaerolineales bacterium]|nr:GntR family transcriptional regulator [Anaerolineales bacterium]